jgi:photosystem II stability/assembly factor-like uncharacterized protein
MRDLAIRALCTALLLFAGAAPTSAQGWEWQNPRPAGYDINDVVYTGSLAFAACDGGVLMRSWDGGRTWESRRRFNDDLMRIERLPDGTLLVTTSQGGLYRSSSYGWEWEDALGVQQAAGNTDIELLPDGNALALLGGRTVFRSSLGATTWNPIAQPPLVQSEFLMRIAVRNEREWWLLSTRKVYRTSDAGGTWIEDSTLQQRGLVDLVFVDPQTVWQLRDGQVLRSRDGMATWTEMNLYGFGYNFAIAVSPPMQNRIFILSDNEYTLNRSIDGGDTWDVSMTSIAFGGGYPNDMAFSSSSEGLVVGSGGRILRTEDGGLSWSIVHGIGLAATIYDMHVFSARDAYALTSGEKVLVTSNGGVRWSELLPLPGWSIGECSFNSDTEGFAAARPPSFTKNAVFATTDRGRTWSHRSDLPFEYDPFFPFVVQSLLAVSNDEVWVGTSMGGLYRSTDGGRSWDSLFVSPQLQNEYYSGTKLQKLESSTILYFSQSSVSITTDNGATWVYRRTPQGRSLVHPHFFDAQDGVALVGGAFARTTNGGVNWALSPENALSHLSVIDQQNFVAFRSGATTQTASGFTTSATVHSSDGGATWTERPIGERIEPNGMRFVSREEGWLWGWSGMIRRTGNGGLVHTAEAPAAVAADAIDIVALHPQPFISHRHRTLTVAIDASRAPGTTIEVELVDALGRLCALRTVAAGVRSSLVFDRSQLPSAGMYTLRLRSGSHHTSRPLLVL